MSIFYHPGKANVVIDVLSRFPKGSTTHFEDDKKDIANDVHNLERLGVWPMDFTEGG